MLPETEAAREYLEVLVKVHARAYQTEFVRRYIVEGRAEAVDTVDDLFI